MDISHSDIVFKTITRGAVIGIAAIHDPGLQNDGVPVTRVSPAPVRRRGASNGEAVLALGWFGSHPKELGDISQKPDESDRRGNKTAARIDDNLGSRELDATALGQNPTSACRKDILNPSSIRSIGEEKDVVIAPAEHVEVCVVDFPRGSPPIVKTPKPGARPANRRVRGLTKRVTK